MSDLGAPATGTASASQVPDGWLSMESAPRDGSVILGWYGDAEQERVRWAEERHCMLSTVAPGAGLFGPGWENTEGLNAEDPIAWKPATGTEPQAAPDANVSEDVRATAFAALHRHGSWDDVLRALDAAAPLIVAEERTQIAARLVPFLETIAGWFDDLATADVPDLVGHQAAVRAGQVRDRIHLLSHGERPL